jgi:hypothetical protein
MLHGIENGIGSMVQQHHAEIVKSISALSTAAGELAVATHTSDDDAEEAEDEAEEVAR